jgi:polysaccharide pyruvyl transferase WcaK-like protein
VRVTILNSDLAKNRGDRAIAEGLIELIKTRYDSPVITGLSETPDRDSEWLGINFLHMDANSLNPIAWCRLAWNVFRADVVYWGGGEILKDYTNKLALWYWAAKISWLRLFNSQMYGAFQGIGPTLSPLSKKLIAYSVNRTRKFVVRDPESFQKLVDWGVDPSKLITSTDPAVLPLPGALTEGDKQQLEMAGVDASILDNFIAIAPRNWFHYRPGGFLPFRYRAKLSASVDQIDNSEYRMAVAELVRLAAGHATNVLLIPMHMSEDVDFCASILEHLDDQVSVRVLDKDSLSPELLRKLIAEAELMIGFRLHSNIIATAASIPSVNFYYVDKGRVFFDQIGQSEFALPIETMLQAERQAITSETLERAMSARAKIKVELTKGIGELRGQLRQSFQELHRNNESE